MESSNISSFPSPLHRAAREGQEEALLGMLQTGLYEVNSGGVDLVRPLHEASLNGHLNCVRVLLEFGAQVNICNLDGETPLCEAVCSGSVEVVKLLLQHGALVNPPLALSSPLNRAVINNQCECAEVLLAHGASVNAIDYDFGTPLHAAALIGHIQCADILLHHGANVNAKHHIQTALHLSCIRQDWTMAQMLLNHGADVYARDSSGKTARDHVPALRGCNGTELIKLLLTWEKNPKSLAHYCRLSVKQALGRRGLHALQNLQMPLPQKIKDFILFVHQKHHV